MSRSIVTCMMPLCAVMQATFTFAADECPRQIVDSCEIKKKIVDKGPLFTIPANVSGEVIVNASINAISRNEAIRISGESPDLSLTVNPAHTVSASYTALSLKENASSKLITVDGTIKSLHEHAIKAEPGSDYNITVNGLAATDSLYTHAIHIDGQAKGTLTINGEVKGGEGGGLLYSTQPDRLGSGTPGNHNLIISDVAKISSTDSELSGAPITIGSPSNAHISKTLPVYSFDRIEINGLVSGGNAGIALNHGELQAKEFLISRYSTIEGINSAIRLGRYSGESSHASYTGTITNEGFIRADDTAIIGEGDIDATIVNQGFITPKPGSEANITALDFSLATKPLKFTQNSGATQGDILGNPAARSSIMFDGGSYSGSIHDADTIDVTSQLSLKVETSPTESAPSSASTQLSFSEITNQQAPDLTLDLTKGSYRGKLVQAKTLTINKETRLQLTEPSVVESANISGFIGLDLDTMGTAPSYIQASDSVTFGDNAEVQVHVIQPQINEPYVLFHAPTMTGEPQSLTTSNLTLKVEGRTETDELFKEYLATFTVDNSNNIDERLILAGVSPNERAAFNGALEYGPESTRNILLDNGEDIASTQRLAQELTPNIEPSTTNFQTTLHKVSSHVQARLSKRGVNTGDPVSHFDHGFWVQISRDNSDQNKRKDVPGYKGDQNGFTLGYDYTLPDTDNTFGLAFSALDAEVKYKKGSNRLNTDFYMLTVYTDTPTSLGDLQSQFSYGRGDNESLRFLNSTKHTADYNSNLFNMQLLLRNQVWDIPARLIGGLNLTRVDNDSHSYKGPNLNETVKSSDATALEAGVGIEYSANDEHTFQPRAVLMGWYDLNNDKIDTRYTIGSSPTLTVKGPKKERLTFTGEVGLDYLWDSFTFSADVTGIWRSGFSDVGLLGRVRYEF